MNLYSILSESAVYDALQNLLGTKRRDRGRYVRSQDEYLGLLREFFRTTAPHIRRDMLYIPYTHIIIESSV